jgi:hypothetical protein
MKNLLPGLLFMLGMAIGASAQTTPTVTSFTFDGGFGPTAGAATGCVNVLSQDTTVFPQPYLPNPWTGYAMCFQVDTYALAPGWFITLDSVMQPKLPNNGYLADCAPLTYAAKVWGTRSDGTVMNGTEASDSYVLPAYTTCPYGVVNGHVNLDFTYEPSQVRVCTGRYNCHYVQKLLPVFKGGNGTVQY